MLKITPIEATQQVTKLSCPCCNERVPQVALTSGSKIEGLTFKCKRCGKYFSVTTK